jgi:hypothetical protein
MALDIDGGLVGQQKVELEAPVGLEIVRQLPEPDAALDVGGYELVVGNAGVGVQVLDGDIS